MEKDYTPASEDGAAALASEPARPAEENPSISAAEVQEHVCARIAAAEVRTEPFPHCYVAEVFPEPFYRALLRQLPRDDFYSKYPPPYEARLFFNLDPGNAQALGAFWGEFEGWINGQPFLDRMAEKFGPFLAGTYAQRKALVDGSTDGDVVRIGCRTLVTRDYGDFALGPHSDSPSKFITAIFYLPADDRFAAFGTSIYRPKQPGFRSWKSTHYKHDLFEVVRTFPNVPNSLFVFMKSDISFHGVEPGDYPNDGRNMLMWVPDIGMSDRNWGPLRLPRRLLTV